MEIIKEINLEDQKIIQIVRDEDPHNPRQDDTFSTMLCFHSGYNLGDNHGYNKDDYGGWDSLKHFIVKNERPLIIKELHMYDHGGIAISTSPFSCRWDSGQIGYVWISQNHIDHIGCHMQDSETWQDYISRLDKYLENEVTEYNDYLQGNVYGFQLIDEDKNIIDSCYGFIGDDFSQNGLYDYIGRDLLRKT